METTENSSKQPKSQKKKLEKKCLHFSIWGPKKKKNQVVGISPREVRWGLGSIQSLLPTPPEPQNTPKTHIFKIFKNPKFWNFEISKLRYELEVYIPQYTCIISNKNWGRRGTRSANNYVVTCSQRYHFFLRSFCCSRNAKLDPETMKVGFSVKNYVYTLSGKLIARRNDQFWSLLHF